LRGGLLFRCVVNSLFKLFIGNIFIVCIINSLFKLSFGNIYIICILKQLFKLSCGNLSSLNGIHELYSVSRRIILRYHGPDFCYRSLCSGLVFGFLGDRML